MPFQTKSNLPKELKFKINLYQLLRRNLEGLTLSESQVLGLMAKDSNFYGRVEDLKRKANKSLSKKQIDQIKKDIEKARAKYGIK